MFILAGPMILLCYIEISLYYKVLLFYYFIPFIFVESDNIKTQMFNFQVMCVHAWHSY
jgi:hypothetical protein